MRYKVIALYKFTTIASPAALKKELFFLCDEHKIGGTMIIAHEGINGTIAGKEEDVKLLEDRLLGDPIFAGIEMKSSYAETQPFYRIRISIKPEIVTMGLPEINPAEQQGGEYVDPQDWNEILQNPDCVVIDTRNDYEISIGTFQNAVNPNTKSFKEFPKYIEDTLGNNRHKPIAMYCTGGIRCEKASSYLKKEGFEKVYQLKGGILKYLEEVEQDKSMWNGECFVFDQRVSVVHGLEKGNTVLCRSCRHPLKPEELISSDYQEGVACPYCISTLTEEKIQSAKERMLQIRLAQERNSSHLGYQHPSHALKKKKLIEQLDS